MFDENNNRDSYNYSGQLFFQISLNFFESSFSRGKNIVIWAWLLHYILEVLGPLLMP